MNLLLAILIRAYINSKSDGSGSMALEETDTPIADDSQLQVSSGDLLTVFYDDPTGDWGTPEQVRSTALYAATVVKGSTILSSGCRSVPTMDSRCLCEWKARFYRICSPQRDLECLPSPVQYI